MFFFRFWPRRTRLQPFHPRLTRPLPQNLSSRRLVVGVGSRAKSACWFSTESFCWRSTRSRRTLRRARCCGVVSRVATTCVAVASPSQQTRRKAARAQDHRLSTLSRDVLHALEPQRTPRPLAHFLQVIIKKYYCFCQKKKKLRKKTSHDFVKLKWLLEIMIQFIIFNALVDLLWIQKKINFNMNVKIFIIWTSSGRKVKT